ncbi:MAG: methyltransferase [Planctomycetes bacterium]|nr:methyltransferase [Planctomycetota bacterium]
MTPTDDSNTFDTVTCSGLAVSHSPDLDGGGPRTWPHFIQTVRRHVGEQVNHAFEWCAGPGYIGFALLGAGLCNKLTLADINPVAVAACRRTIEQNGLADRVTVYLSNNLADIPDSERWDLVIGDPPHFREALPRHIERGFELRSVDPDWSIHREFFRTLTPHLNPGARVLISESRVAGNYDDLFTHMMTEAGLELVEPIWELPEMRRYCLLGKWGG